MFSIKTILHPTDFTEPSEAALRYASTLAADYRAQLVILHVISMPAPFGEVLGFFNTANLQNDVKEELTELEVPDQKVDVVRRLEQGNPATEILDLARLCQADLIVMGTHGQRGFKRYLTRSVAAEVVRQALCPVLTVQAPASQRAPRLEQRTRSIGR